MNSIRERLYEKKKGVRTQSVGWLVGAHGSHRGTLVPGVVHFLAPNFFEQVSELLGAWTFIMTYRLISAIILVV